MAIYLMHILAGSGTRILLSRFLGVTDAAAHLILGTIAGVAIPLALIWLLGNKSEWLIAYPRKRNPDAMFHVKP